MNTLKRNELPRTVNGLFELVQLCEEQSFEEEASELSFVDQWQTNEMSQDWAGTTGKEQYRKNINSMDRVVAGAQITGEFKKTEGFAFDLTPSVEGQFNDPVAYLEGHPECMADFMEQPANNYKTLIWSAAVRGSADITDMQRLSKQICEAVNAYEITNTRVRVELFFGSANGKTGDRFRMILKDYQDSYIPHIHAAALADFATVRALGYTYWSRFNRASGLGYQYRDVEECRSHYVELFGEMPEGTILICSDIVGEKEVKKLLSVL